MIRYIAKLIRAIGRKSPNTSESIVKIVSSLESNIAYISEIFGSDNDFVIRQFTIPIGETKAAAVYIDGLVNTQIVNNSILAPLMIESRRFLNNPDSKVRTIDDIMNGYLLAGETETVNNMSELIDACLNGDTALIVDGMDKAALINTKGFEKRAVTEPETENVVRGPREGFTELLRVNTALIRRKLKTRELRMEHMVFGQRSKTQVCLTYIDGIANPAMLTEVRNRLKTINTDAILNNGYVEEFIEDNPFSVFQTIGYTEKPDIVAAKLLEGRCALIIDGTPFVLTMPMLFVENFQSPEDYVVRAYFGTFLRILRMFAYLISLITPAAYVALTTFHHELIPTSLLFTIAAASEGVPFPAFIETSIMLFTFEIIKEAGLRLPRPTGQAVSIVGALVMGQAAIQAGIVGAPVVIIIALSAVASFVSPNISDSTSILRWYLLILSTLIGGYGIIIGLMTILIHVASLKSFGSIYMHPLAPLHAEDMKDTFIRVPMWLMRSRPSALYPNDKTRSNMRKPEFGRDDNV